MEFYNMRTQYQYAKAKGDCAARDHLEYAKGCIEMLENVCAASGSTLRDVDPFTPVGLLAEADWAEARMPYYNLWPTIIPVLTKLKLDVEAQFFRLPISPLLIRFPTSVPHPLTWSYEGKQWSIQTMMVCEGGVRAGGSFRRQHNMSKDTDIPALSFWLDIGELVVATDPMFRHKLYKHLLKVPGWTIERSFKEIPAHDSVDSGVQYPESIIEDCARLACTLCLMAASPELIVPDVLASDKSKFAATGDESLVEKAHRRGKIGWNVGADIEVAPHYRNACPAALYWTGEGRRVPRIRFRKGSFIHRERLSEVPTGFLLKEGEPE